MVQQTTPDSIINVDTVIIFAVLATTIAIGFIGHRASKTITGYMFANKSLGPWLLSFSIMATYFSAASFLGGGGATYLYNLGFGAWLTAWHVIGVVALWLIVAGKLFNYISKSKVMSIPELIEHRYGSFTARLIASTIIVALFTLYLSSVYKGGAIILSSQLKVDMLTALLILAIPVMIYLVTGGMKAATVNNLFLGSMMLTAAILTFYYIMSYIGGPINGLKMLSNTTILGKYPGELWLRIDGMGPPPAMEKNAVPLLIMSITFSIGMAQVALPNLLIQFYAAKDSKAIERGRLIGPILVALYAMFMFSLGVFCHLIIDNKLLPQEVAQLLKDTDWVIPKTVSIIVGPALRGLILAAPVAASMSTIALTVLTLSNTIVRDFIQPFTKNKNESTLVVIAKLMSVVFALIPVLLAIIENKLIVEIVGAAFGTIFACFVGPITIGLRWRRASREGAIASMIVGAVVGITWYLYLYRTTWVYPTIPATLLSILVFTILSIAKKNR
ncbi:MAG: sodium/solute symporter [Ignisphaera sp.]